VGTFVSDSTINRQCAQQRQQNQDDCRDGSQRTGGKEGDARLVAQRGKIIDSGEAHYLEPGMVTVMLLLTLKWSF
jgi:hypothetical protein